MAKRKTKLPKRIAGFKVPKKLRKTGGTLLALLDTPHGRQAAAAALSAAAAALVGTKTGRRAAASAEGAVMDAGSAAADQLGSIGQTIGSTIQEVAKAVLPETLTGADKAEKKEAQTPVDKGKSDAPRKGRPAPVLLPPQKH